MTAGRETTDARARRLIRESLDATLLVEAAAGTGKTTELIERLVNVVGEGRASIGAMVVVTFTEKAAGELKLRLRQRLDDLSREATDSVRQARLVDALAHLEEAHVNTIHGFCADLLRERPVEAGVDPRFAVLTEDESRAMFRLAFDEWLRRALSRPSDGVRRALRRHTRGRDDDESGPVERLARAAWTLAEWRDLRSPWRSDAFDRDEAMRRLVARVHEVAALTATCGRRDRDNLFTDTAPLRDLARDLDRRERAGVADPDGLEARFIAFAQEKHLKRMRKGAGAEYGPGVLRADVHGAALSLVESFVRFAAEADANLAASLQTELLDVVDRYDALKLASGRLDFVDLLLRARDLVVGHETVRSDLQRRFARIFVDEFQDTDPIQIEMLMLLASDDPAVADWREVRPTPGKLFIVGDPKQSIYRFRRADVAAYWEVRAQLVARGAEAVELGRSFRSRPALQRFVNAAFAPIMTGDATALQPGYVALHPVRDDHPDQPAVVALPVPSPYGVRNLRMLSIEESLPDAVAAFVQWLLSSGWTVGDDRRPIQAQDVALLFRRFESWGTDVTRAYVEALDARGVPHLLVGGRAFRDREEVMTLEAALSAIEWPDDELSVFATLKGSLFAIPDSALLVYRHRYGRLHPFKVPAPLGRSSTDPIPAPASLGADLAAIAAALDVLASLHRRRNRVPVAETVAALLESTRAHAGFVLRPRGEQALANVLHVAELARRYDVTDGLSFRGFVRALHENRFAESGEAPVLEEGSDGVRLMTVHKAKGLEFPVVVLADMTANLASYKVDRHIDAGRGLCALRLSGWAPRELLEAEDVERARDHAEGVRVAYVASTRARDLLVVPGIGDGPLGNDDKWLSPLDRALYPRPPVRRQQKPAVSCPPFGKDSVVNRPDGPYRPDTVAPGLHSLTDDNGNAFDVVWWDPHLLYPPQAASYGLRQTELIGPEVAPSLVAADVARHREWQETHHVALAAGARPSLSVETTTSRAHRSDEAAAGVEVIAVRTAAARPAGRRFGTLVHEALSVVPLSADRQRVRDVVALRGRVLGASASEVTSAVEVVAAALEHDVIARARAAERRGRCRRETPVTLVDADGTLVDGQVDLAFEEDGIWWVVDFKTDRDLERSLDVYLRQTALYARAIERATGQGTRPLILNV